MTRNCCKKKGSYHDSSMSLLINTIASKTKPSKGWPAALNSGDCCKNNNSCSCKTPLYKSDIYRNKQIHQVLKNCRC